MISPELKIIFSLITSFLITYISIPVVISFSKKLRLLDDAGIRASHKGSVPIFGGVAIFSGIIFTLFFWSDIENLQFHLLSILIVFFVGIIDDLLVLSPFKKIVGQVIATLIIIFFGNLQIDNMHGVLGVYELPIWISTLFTVFVVIVITNGYNLIDGVDGLAAGIGVISSFSFGIISLLMIQFDMAILAFTLVGSLLGFLKFNFFPAKIFMGDTGSLVVGIILSILAINIIRYGLVTDNIKLPNKGPLLVIAILAISLFDSLRVFIVRIIKGRHPLSAGREHIHHNLLGLGFGHKKTSLILYSFTILVILFSYFLIDLNVNLGITIIALINFIILYIPFYLLKVYSK
tara:strand:+ start:1540 stop:2583 length:1044 start_codon:yes stop_codon:yes gene_type:complete